MHVDYNESTCLLLQNILRFWLDKGVDGFHIRNVQYLYEDHKLGDESPIPGRAGQVGVCNSYVSLAAIIKPSPIFDISGRQQISECKITEGYIIAAKVTQSLICPFSVESQCCSGLELWPRKRNVGCSNPSRDGLKS